MSDDQSNEAIRQAAREELDALEAQLPTLRRALLPWVIRVVILSAALAGFMIWRETPLISLGPLVLIYASVSFALTYFAYSAKHKAFAKRRARFEASLADEEPGT